MSRSCQAVPDGTTFSPRSRIEVASHAVTLSHVTPSDLNNFPRDSLYSLMLDGMAFSSSTERRPFQASTAETSLLLRRQHTQDLFRHLQESILSVLQDDFMDDSL